MLDNEKEADVNLEGYEKKKKGRGVALFVNCELKCKNIESMSIQRENILESVTVKIDMDKAKNITISCIYRTPGSWIQLFNDTIIDIYDKMNDKIIFVC